MNNGTAATILATFLWLTQWQAAAADAPMSERVAKALNTAADSKTDVTNRVAAIKQLRRSKYAEVSEPLLALLKPAQPDPIRLEVINTLGKHAEPGSVAMLLKRWPDFTPAVKQRVLQTLTTHAELAREFLKQLGDGALPLGEVDTATRQRFQEFPDEQLAADAKKLFVRQPLLDARATLARFKPALALKGDAKRGREIFRDRTCFNCHRVANEGIFVGAELFNVINMPREELLQNIVAPNLFFMPNFQMFSAETEEGEIHEGVMAGTTETKVILRRAGGEESILAKNELKRLKGLNVSLMPEGLIEGLSFQQVSDLLEFIKTQE